MRALLFLWLSSGLFAASVITRTGNMTITGTVQSTGGSFAVPSAAINLSPSNSNTHVIGSGLVLSWQNGGAALNYDVIGPDTFSPPTTVSSSAQAGTTYAATVNDGTQYYWKIVSRNAVGTTSTSVFTFTTVAPFVVTSFVDFEDGAIGNVPTTTNVAAATYGAAGTWTRSATAATYSELESFTLALYTPVKISSTTYLGGGTRAVRFRMDQTQNYFSQQLGSNTDTLSFSCWFRFGPNPDGLIDFISLGTEAGGFAILQASPNSQFHAHWGGAGSGSYTSTNFTLSPGTTYRVEIIGIRYSDSTVLNVYLTDGTLVASRNMLLSQDYDSPFKYVQFGRIDAHGGAQPPATSWAEFDNVAWSTTGVNPIAP